MYSYEELMKADLRPSEFALEMAARERATEQMRVTAAEEAAAQGIKYKSIHMVDGDTVAKANTLRYRLDCAEYDARVGAGMVSDGRSLIAQGQSQQERAAIARERAEAELVETLGSNWRELLSTIRPLPLRGH